MKDRIRQLMESQHMTQQTFSDFIGISSASLSSIFTGRTKPTLNTVEAIRSKFTKINLDWLMYGQGPMFKDSVNNGQSEDAVSSLHQPIGDGKADIDSNYSMSPYENSDTNFADDSNSSSMFANKQLKAELKYIDKPQRKITEIRIFFDDQTWESFVPKK